MATRVNLRGVQRFCGGVALLLQFSSYWAFSQLVLTLVVAMFQEKNVSTMRNQMVIGQTAAIYSEVYLGIALGGKRVFSTYPQILLLSALALLLT